jgi:hypothetical protein
LAEGDLERAARELPESDPVRRAALAARGTGRDGAAVSLLGEQATDPFARGEILLLAAKRSLEAGDLDSAAGLLARVGDRGLARYRGRLRADLLVARAGLAAGRLDGKAIPLLVEAAALVDADRAEAGTLRALAFSIVRWREGAAAADVVRFLDAAERARLPLPSEAARVHVDRALDCAKADSWETFMEQVAHAQRIDPNVALPEAFGRLLTARAGVLIHGVSLNECYDLIVDGARLGIRTDVSGDLFFLLGRKEPFALAIKRDPNDWALRLVDAQLNAATAAKKSRRIQRTNLARLAREGAAAVLETPGVPYAPWGFALEIELWAAGDLGGMDAARAVAEGRLKQRPERTWTVTQCVARMYTEAGQDTLALRWTERGLRALESRQAGPKGLTPLEDSDRRRVAKALGATALKLGDLEALGRAIALFEGLEAAPDELETWRKELARLRDQRRK